MHYGRFAIWGSLLFVACASGAGNGSDVTRAARQASTGSCGAGAGAKVPFASGSGTVADPYSICSLEQLERVGSFLASHFVLSTDIDASSTDPALSSGPNAGADGFVPIGGCGPDNACNTSDDVPFTGTFDGGGHVIFGLYIHRPTRIGVGLFGQVSGTGALVKNVKLANVRVSGNGWVGALVGHLVASVDACASSGTVVGSPTSTDVGGLVGQIGTIGGPFTTRSITHSSSSVNVSAGDVAGGLVGDVQWGAEVIESHATGSVVGGNQVGGLIGDQYNATEQNDYATALAESSHGHLRPRLVGGLGVRMPQPGVRKLHIRHGPLSGLPGRHPMLGVGSNRRLELAVLR